MLLLEKMKILSHTIKRDLIQRSWKVIYTRPRWEKKVDTLLHEAGVESYCPVKKEYHKWADRMKIVEVPLFSSYVLVYSNAKEESLIRQTLGVINFIYFQGRPAVVAETEIDRIKYFMEHNRDIEVVSVNQLSQGDRIMIKTGALKDQVGNVLKIQGKNVLMILDHLGCVIVTKVAAENTVLA